MIGHWRKGVLWIEACYNLLVMHAQAVLAAQEHSSARRPSIATLVTKAITAACSRPFSMVHGYTQLHAPYPCVLLMRAVTSTVLMVPAACVCVPVSTASARTTFSES